MLDSLMSSGVELGLSCVFVGVCVGRQDLSPGCWGGGGRGEGRQSWVGGTGCPIPAIGTNPGWFLGTGCVGW